MEKLKMGKVEYSTLARVLRKVDFFAPMTIGQMENVLPYILHYSYDKGETVFKQGEKGDAFYIVDSGLVDVKIKDGLLSKKTVSRLGPGDFFGEMALLSADPRSATVVTVEPTKLFVLLSIDFQYILKKNPTFAEDVAKIAARRRFDSKN